MGAVETCPPLTETIFDNNAKNSKSIKGSHRLNKTFLKDFKTQIKCIPFFGTKLAKNTFTKIKVPNKIKNQALQLSLPQQLREVLERSA